jgi:hypothetical protein
VGAPSPEISLRALARIDNFKVAHLTAYHIAIIP